MGCYALEAEKGVSQSAVTHGIVVSLKNSLESEVHSLICMLEAFFCGRPESAFRLFNKRLKTFCKTKNV